MCGIVATISQSNASQSVLKGLEALEYRGYDSAGISTSHDQSLTVYRQVGAVKALRGILDESEHASAKSAIGHTRWATHGGVSVENAHPHTNNAKTIAVVHNGIIENYLDIKAILEKNGYTLTSETDTEVIPHLIDYYIKTTDSPLDAFTSAIADLRGAYAICAQIASEPDTIYAAKLGSPLAITHTSDSNIITSDPVAIRSAEQKATYLEDDDIAVVSKSNHEIFNIKDERTKIRRDITHLDYDAEQAKLGDYPHYMLKEIYEAPTTVKNATRGRIRPNDGLVQLGGLVDVQRQLRYIDRIIIVACGTSYYAGLLGEYLFEELADIPVEVQLASEFKYRQEPFSRGSALLAISQSGETADTIAALKKVEDYGMLRLGIVNAIGSTIARLTDAGVYCHAGPEQSVASTKAFIAQVTVLTEMALAMSKHRSPSHQAILDELTRLPDKLKAILDQSDNIKQVALSYIDANHMLFIGRGYHYPTALEGALKLKEISYIHAEGYAAGELKHGPLALIEPTVPTLAIAPDNDMLNKTLSNIEEIKARNGSVIAITNSDTTAVINKADHVIVTPSTLPQLEPLLVAVALQLFAYHIAVHKGLNVDRPRNLAKSVTVE